MKGNFPSLHANSPVYDSSISPLHAEKALAALLNQLKLCAPPQHILKLNQANAHDMHTILTSVRGIGTLSVNKILSVRELGGDFLSATDFDRRVRGLTFVRLQKLCRVHGVVLSLSPSPSLGAASRLCQSGRGGVWWRGVDKVVEAVTGSVAVATWNAGRMSRRGRFYEKKMGHLERFVQECRPDVLVLQEVCRGVARELRGRLKVVEGIWEVFEEGGGDSSLAMVYRTDRVRVGDVGGVELGVLEGFLREPLVGKVNLVGRNGKGFVLVNVHLEQRDPRKEIERLGEVVRVLQRVGSVVLAGDFNMSADTRVYEGVRKRGMVEIVRPGGGRKVHPYQVLNCATTVGGEWLDNFWVEENRRGDVQDAWCFEFGGRGRRLGASGYEFAAERRSCSSDHLPLMMRIACDADESRSRIREVEVANTR